jgi:hypothetical protein
MGDQSRRTHVSVQEGRSEDEWRGHVRSHQPGSIHHLLHEDQHH